MANQPVQCSCSHNKSPSLSDLTVALMDTKKAPPSEILRFSFYASVFKSEFLNLNFYI